MRWNNLHYQFRKEFRRADSSGSTWPYLERLRFLADNPQRPKNKYKNKCKDSTDKREPGSHEATLWEAYEDGETMEETGTFMIEEIIEEHDQIIQEEIIYEEVDSESAEILSPSSSFLQVDRMLAQLGEPQRIRAERRITAFLLKCQLRSLSNQSVDDLII